VATAKNSSNSASLSKIIRIAKVYFAGVQCAMS
jgi:hypothetical protein